MRVMGLVKATDDSELGTLPSAELMEAMGRFNEELRQAGILRLADGLKPSSQGKRVAFDGAGRTVISGPFAQTQAQTRELVAGFWLWEVRDIPGSTLNAVSSRLFCRDANEINDLAVR